MIGDGQWTTGMVLRVEPFGEYDKRLVLLTREHGRVTAFARGARRPTNHLAAATDHFVFGKFRLYAGRSAYSMSDAAVVNYFPELRLDYDAAMLGMYFLEVMEVNTREENDEAEQLKLLYQSLRALLHPDYDNRLVRAVLELKMIMIQGEFMREKYRDGWNAGTLHALDYLLATPPERVYSFALKEEALSEVVEIAGKEMAAFHGGHAYRSAQLLQ